MDKYLSLVAEEYEAKETGDLLEDKERVYKESLTAEELIDEICSGQYLFIIVYEGVYTEVEMNTIMVACLSNFVSMYEVTKE